MTNVANGGTGRGTMALTTRQKLKDRVFTPEWRRKLSENNVGNLGRHLPKEHRQKIAKAREGIKPSLKNRLRSSEANADRVFSAAHRQRISDAKKHRPSPAELATRFGAKGDQHEGAK